MAERELTGSLQQAGCIGATTIEMAKNKRLIIKYHFFEKMEGNTINLSVGCHVIGHFL